MFPSNQNQLKRLHAISIIKGTREPSLWSQITSKYIYLGFSRQALLVYKDIQSNGTVHHTLVPLALKACSSLSFCNHGKALHSQSMKLGLIFNVVIGTSLISMYSKCSKIGEACMVFDEMPVRNVITWNAMIGGYCINGDIANAMILFNRTPARTMVTWSEMISGYAKRGKIKEARCLFDQVPNHMKNVVIWSVMVDGYASNGEMEAAKNLFDEMPDRNFFSWSSMIAGYCKKGDVRAAKDLFDKMPVKNLVNWNSMIAGYAQNGLCKEALDLFSNMQMEGFEPDEVSIASALSACSQLGCLESGKKIHEMIRSKRIKPNAFIWNGLVDMYAKCGDIENAKQLFENMPQRNNVCWNSMISGLAFHGQGEEALKLFYRMQMSNVKPNERTFLAVLSACSHGGHVSKGLQLFELMEKKYNLNPGIEHYGCLVDLLGRAGRLQEGYNLIKRMPMKPNSVVWGALLGSCKIHSDLEMAKKVVSEVRFRDSKHGCDDDGDRSYVVLSNMYAAANRWEEAEKARMSMASNCILKSPGFSSISVEDVEHCFLAAS